MAAQTITTLGITGNTVAMVAADGVNGDNVANNGNLRVRIDNASAAAVTVTFHGERPCNMGFLHDDPVSIPANTTMDFGPFDIARFSDSNGKLNWTYSSAASVTVGVYQ